MTRTVRIFGPALLIGKRGVENTFAFNQAFEASPIYQSAEISLRIWGSRTRTSSGVVTTDTIDQTETVTFTRGFSPLGDTALAQIEFTYAPGDIEFGPSSQGSGIYAKFGVSQCIATEQIDEAFLIGQNEHLWNPIAADAIPSPSDISDYVGRINPKRQRLLSGGAPSSSPIKTFSYSRTVTPPGTTSSLSLDVTLAFPHWASLVEIPAYGRGQWELWGYRGLSTGGFGSSDTAYIDTDSWTAEQWRDYRGTWVFPEQDMTIGWDSGDMKAQWTAVLS